MRNPCLKGYALGNAVAIISLKQIRDNFNYLKKIASPSICMPVLKANAYGIGALKVLSALVDEIEGCFVATPSEAYSLREYIALQAHKKIKIFVLHGFLPGEAEKLADLELIPVINTECQAQEWRSVGKGRPCAIHIDSGMSRLGISFKEIENPVFKKINPILIMSHLACADQKFHPKNQEQLKYFSALSNTFFPNIAKSIAASDGIFLGKEFLMDVVRPGISLYANISQDNVNPFLKDAISIKAPVFQISEYDSGKAFGYSSSWVANRKTMSATVGIGYADCCLSSRYRNHDIFLQKHKDSFPIIGKTSMDSIIIDITDAKHSVRIGDFVELLGEDQDILTLAKRCEITPHEVLTSLGSRISREYLS
ncbi:alanine racemase [Acetobacteraceae bacterium]|nr:alanine racemase [Acetobacteraceae bacterium]